MERACERAKFDFFNVYYLYCLDFPEKNMERANTFLKIIYTFHDRGLGATELSVSIVYSRCVIGQRTAVTSPETGHREESTCGLVT